MTSSLPGVDHASDAKALFAGNRVVAGSEDDADVDLNADANGDQDASVDEELVANQIEEEYEPEPESEPYDWPATPSPAGNDEPEVVVSTYIFYRE